VTECIPGSLVPWYVRPVDAIAPARCDQAPGTTNLLPWALLALLFAESSRGAPLDTMLPDSVGQGGSAQVATRADPIGGNVDDALFATPTTHDHIGRVVVPVKINGRGPYRFIVDTGANHSTISPGLVRELGLTTATQSLITLDGITGAAQVTYVAIDRLQAGDLTLDDTTLPVVWAPVMAGADGILGAAGMSEKSLLIDFKRNRVAIASHIGSNSRDQGIKIHAARVVNGLMVLDAMVAGVRVAAVLDTGAERTLGNIALRDVLKRQTRPDRSFVAQLTSVYGATQEIEAGEISRAPLISIGSLRITDVAVVYGNFHIFKIWEMQDKPAMILGMDVLGTVAALNIDFKNQNVYVASASTTNVRDQLGSVHDLSAIQAQKK
jgi:predicted aspartyl protease